MDTGADVSVFPPTAAERRHPSSSLHLQAANGTAIKTFGQKLLVLDLGLRRPISWPFLIADCTKPIIGSDLLFHYSLAVDLRHCRLVDQTTALASVCALSSDPAPGLRLITQANQFSAILTEFPDITKPILTVATVKHDVTHRIITTGHPVACRHARRLPPDKYAAAKAEYEYLCNEGMARRSDSEWSSPLHMVPKPTAGDWRSVGDYRRLNAITVPDRYPVPHLHDFANGLHGCSVFSKIDLVRAFNQIPVHADDVKKTAVLTPFGLFEHLFMPFGLRNAAQTFQRFIDHVLRGLDFVYAYIDDLLVASKSDEEHAAHLRLLFQRLNEYGVILSPTKCEFGASELHFLGYHINKDGARPSPKKVEAITSFPQPAHAKGLQRFLAMIAFYQRFIPRAAATLAPLYGAIDHKRKNHALDWTPVLTDAFAQAKDMLATATLLAYPLPSAPLCLACDASDTAIGSVLQQRVDGQWQPLAFFSRKLDSRDQSRSPYDKELLAIFASIRHFQDSLEGRPFTVFTDHKPLTFALGQVTEKMDPRRRRKLEFIAQFTSDIRHVAGADNVVADTLSRIEAISPGNSFIDFDAMASAQETDSDLQRVRNATDTLLQLQQIPVAGSSTALWCDTSTPVQRPFVPLSFRRQVFDSLHGLAHDSIRSTVRKISERFVWPSMQKDIPLWTRACATCQKSKVQRHTKSAPGSFSLPDKRFEHIHADIITMTERQGMRYCLTVIDRYTRWPQAIPLPDMEALTVARALLSGWISLYGVPLFITTDQGRQFESHLFKSLLSLLGSRRCRTVAFHPQSNGMVERMHRWLKAAIKAREQDDWVDSLPLVLLGLRTAFKEDIASSAAEMVYGTSLRIPGAFLTPTEADVNDSHFVQRLKDTMAALRPVPASSHASDGTFLHPDLVTCSHVLVRNDTVRKPLQPPYDGPFLVVKRTDKFFVVRLDRGDVTVSLDRLKPFFIVHSPTPTQPSPSIVTESPPPPPDTSTPVSLAQSRPKRCVRFNAAPDFHYF